MKPTEILSGEHRVIEIGLDALEAMTRQALADGRLEAAPARQAVDFIRNFADRCHHGKEEARLFPMMEARGFSPECGPTAVMRHEHELGRQHVGAMAEAIAAAAAGDPAALARFADHAGGYVGLLREHIQKEDHCLFAMADQALTEEDQRNLLAQFQQVEHEEMGTGTHERCLKIAEGLAERYGLAHGAIAAAAAHGGYCHHRG